MRCCHALCRLDGRLKPLSASFLARTLADRWTDGSGAAVFREVTAAAGGSSSSSDAPADSNAIAISNSDPRNNAIVDPIPRVDWRCGVIFCKRHYENVAEPVGLVVGKGKTGGAIISLEARAQQERAPPLTLERAHPSRTGTLLVDPLLFLAHFLTTLCCVWRTP